MPSRILKEIRGLMMKLISARKPTPRILLSIGLVVCAVVLLPGTSMRAQPTGGKIMTDVSLTDTGACSTVRIHFDVRIRYINHFPHGQGNEVRIQLKPLAVGSIDLQALLVREAFSPVDEATPLANVIYEGDLDGGPYLSLQFNRAVYFTVAQGTDFRSMNVSFGDTEASCGATNPSSP